MNDKFNNNNDSLSISDCYLKSAFTRGFDQGFEEGFFGFLSAFLSHREQPRDKVVKPVKPTRTDNVVIVIKTNVRKTA